VKVKFGDSEVEVDYLCIAGGRAPDTEALNLEAAGVKTTDRGKVEIDDYQRTSNPKVYAIGDLVGRKALAHKASEEGVVAVEHAAGVETHPVDENLVAGATFCEPQVASVGLTEPGLNSVIRTGYELLGLITFLTAGKQECRAWTVLKGSTAPQAAGAIHTDFERGFIKAEVIWWEDLVALGSEAKCREAGKLAIEGKEYVLRDGDVVHFRFNV
jgi:ribosome-binding ATPase YchF (GTP1/OBG family)